MKGAVARRVALALLAFVATSAVAADGPKLNAKLTPAKATVGDQVTIEVTLTLPPNLRTATPRFPDWEDHWGEAEILGSDAPVRHTLDNGDVRWTQRIRVAAYRTGRIVLPPRRVVIPAHGGALTLQTPSALALSISSVLPSGADASTVKPKPAAPLRALPWGRAFWWSLALGLTALVGAFLWARRRGVSDSSEAPPLQLLPPFEEFQRGLAALTSSEDSMRLHQELSRLFRRYLGRTLGFPAVESTTTEIRRRLMGVHLPPDVVRGSVSLLRRCDEVKFARLRHGEDSGTLREDGLRIAERVEQHLKPPAADVGTEEAA